jgi:hypothetical protein
VSFPQYWAERCTTAMASWRVMGPSGSKRSASHPFRMPQDAAALICPLNHVHSGTSAKEEPSPRGQGPRRLPPPRQTRPGSRAGRVGIARMPPVIPKPRVAQWSSCPVAPKVVKLFFARRGVSPHVVQGG